MVILINGEVGVGKTTMINKLFKDKTINYGFITKIERDNPDKDGYMRVYIHSPNDIKRNYTNKNCVGACKAIKGSSLSYPKIFDTVGVELLSNIPQGETVIMDEIGFMEKDSIKFLDKIKEIFLGDYLVVASIKSKNMSHLDELRTNYGAKVYNINKENRNDLFYEIIKQIESYKQ